MPTLQQTLKSIFGLTYSDNTAEIDLALNPSTPEAKRWAFEGDTILHNTITNFLCKEESLADADVGKLHKKRKSYEKNRVLSEYLHSAAPAIFTNIQSKQKATWSAHSVGTSFEALLRLSSER